MDLLVDVDELNPPVELARPVKNNGRLLLPSGYSIKDEDVKRLREWGVDSVHVTVEPARRIA